MQPPANGDETPATRPGTAANATNLGGLYHARQDDERRARVDSSDRGVNPEATTAASHGRRRAQKGKTVMAVNGFTRLPNGTVHGSGSGSFFGRPMLEAAQASNPKNVPDPFRLPLEPRRAP